MIHEYVHKLIENLPPNMSNTTPLNIDLVLDGGIFNGSYLVGAMYFLKEMEKRNYINIERISGSSIGSIVGFLYLIDALDMMPKLYEVVNNNLKQKYCLDIIKDFKNFLGDRIPNNACELVNNKLYISYNNINKCNKVVKHNFKDIDEIINSIIRSSYVPFLIDGNIIYENKYIDGMNPYIFNKEPNKQILYLDLFSYDKLSGLLNVKNEKTNFHRILSGLLEIHNFYIKQTNTQMCSYVNNWSIINISFNKFKIMLERIVIYIICFITNINKNIPPEFKETVLFKILSKISQDIFIILLESYCL